MRILLVVLTLALSVVVVGGTTQPGPLAILNVTIVDGTGAPPREANVVVREGRIAAITREASPAGATVVDGRGKFLIPGLWDMHVHLATRPEPELAEKMILPLLLAHGIVGVRDMGGPLDRVLELREKVARGEIPGPRILTPGPFVDGPGDASPLFRRPADAGAAAGVAKELIEGGVDFIKVQSGLAPEIHSALARAARTAKRPLAGHVPIAMTAETVMQAGQRSVEHVSPALVGDGMLLFALSSESDALLRELRQIEQDRAGTQPGAIAEREAILRKRLVETYDPMKARTLGNWMKDREVWIVPTLIWSATLRPLTKDEDGTNLPMELVPASLRTRWLERRKEYVARQAPEGFAAAAAVARAAARAVRDLHVAGAQVLAGTDAFDAFVVPGHSLHQELKLLVDAGLSPMEALRTSTQAAAEYRGTARTEGTIEIGRRADLVLLDADPGADISNTRRVHAVVTGGKVYDRDALDKLLRDVRAFTAQ